MILSQQMQGHVSIFATLWDPMFPYRYKVLATVGSYRKPKIQLCNPSLVVLCCCWCLLLWNFQGRL